MWEEMLMQITDIRVRKIEKEGKLKAVASITIDNEFVVHDIKVIIAHPINSTTRDAIQNKILEAYENAAAEEV